MKKILATLLFIPTLAFSQSNKNESIVNIPAYCISIQKFGSLLTEFDELPFVRGKSTRDVNGRETTNSLVIFMNVRTKTWTIAEKVSDDKYCIIATGEDMEVVPQDIIDNIIKDRQQKRS